MADWLDIDFADFINRVNLGIPLLRKASGKGVQQAGSDAGEAKVQVSSLPAGLLGLASEATLEAARVLLATISGAVATAARQDTGNASLSGIDGHAHSLDGKVTACDTTGKATEATLAALNGKVTACDTGAVVVSSSALPALAATSTIQTDGTQKSIVRHGAKGATAAADCTGVAVDADHQALDVTHATMGWGERDSAGAGSGYVASIDRVHDEIHKGHHFFVSMTSPKLDTTSYFWKITTPASPARCHFVLDLSCNVSCNGFLLENPTVNAPGTAMTEFNSDRNSIVAAALAFTYGDTSTADGTQLWSATFGGAGGATKTSGNAGSREEILLKASEEYFVKVTTLANDGFVQMHASWYEE